LITAAKIKDKQTAFAYLTLALASNPSQSFHLFIFSFLLFVVSFGCSRDGALF
jgi:hypothetical protein